MLIVWLINPSVTFYAHKERNKNAHAACMHASPSMFMHGECQSTCSGKLTAFNGGHRQEAQQEQQHRRRNAWFNHPPDSSSCAAEMLSSHLTRWKRQHPGRRRRGDFWCCRGSPELGGCNSRRMRGEDEGELVEEDVVVVFMSMNCHRRPWRTLEECDQEAAWRGFTTARSEWSVKGVRISHGSLSLSLPLSLPPLSHTHTHQQR